MNWKGREDQGRHVKRPGEDIVFPATNTRFNVSCGFFVVILFHCFS